jgi:acyl-homoserine lactone acylase PvdQ
MQAQRVVGWTFAASLVASLCGGSSRAEDHGTEILRDAWGIPHVFAATDEEAFYGLGYATAEDRAFQMTYALRIIQGRLSEMIGEVRKVSGSETSVDHMIEGCGPSASIGQRTARRPAFRA